MATQAQSSNPQGDINDMVARIKHYQKELEELAQRQAQERKDLAVKHQQETEKAQADVTMTRREVAKLFTELGLTTLLGLDQSKASSKGKSAKVPSELGRKPRISSDEVKASLERNKAIYTSTYEKGINEKTGLPNRYKGRSPLNVDIDRMMKQDEEAYATAQGGNAAARANLTDTVNGLNSQPTPKGTKKK